MCIHDFVTKVWFFRRMLTDLRKINLEVMNDDIRFLHICGRLMTGKGIDSSDADAIEADNILYGDFGMSSEDILENLRTGSGTFLCK